MALPTTVILDRDGRVLATQKGSMTMKPSDGEAFAATVKSAAAIAK